MGHWSGTLTEALKYTKCEFLLVGMRDGQLYGSVHRNIRCNVAGGEECSFSAELS